MATMISNEYMDEMRGKTREYTVLLLRRTPRLADPDAFPIVLEHGRRNYQLRADGILPIVCPISNDDDMAGIGIFNAPRDEVDRIMAEDPGVKAGLFTYTLHVCRGIPGDALTA